MMGSEAAGPNIYSTAASTLQDAFTWGESKDAEQVMGAGISQLAIVADEDLDQEEASESPQSASPATPEVEWAIDTAPAEELKLSVMASFTGGAGVAAPPTEGKENMPATDQPDDLGPQDEELECEESYSSSQSEDHGNDKSTPTQIWGHENDGTGEDEQSPKKKQRTVK